jgi:hypothetical protein
MAGNPFSLRVAVQGSLRILSGVNAGGKIDATGDVQAFFNSIQSQVVFNLGAGATATAGGSLAITASTSISCCVQVNSGVPTGTGVENQATISYEGATTEFSFLALSPAAEAEIAANSDVTGPRYLFR